MTQTSTDSLAIGVLTASVMTAEVRIVSMMADGVSMAPVMAAVLPVTSVLAVVSIGVGAASVQVGATSGVVLKMLLVPMKSGGKESIFGGVGIVMVNSPRTPPAPLSPPWSPPAPPALTTTPKSAAPWTRVRSQKAERMAWMIFILTNGRLN